jgi:hypothetical protein
MPMNRSKPADGGSADVTTPLGSARLRGRVPPSWFFIVAAVGLFAAILRTIDGGARPEWVLAALVPPYLLLGYLIRSYAALVRTHGDTLAGNPLPRSRLPPPPSG